MKRYCDSVNGGLARSYNPLERREACKWRTSWPSRCKAFEQQITELKLSVDGLEKERDYYFAKLRDIEILCQSAYAESLPVEEIKRILYAEDDDSMVVADAPAIISDNHQEMQPLGTMLEEAEHEPEGDCNEEKYYQY